MKGKKKHRLPRNPFVISAVQRGGGGTHEDKRERGLEREERIEALDELTHLSQELGLYEELDDES